jgi:ATP-dependent DNA helicase RecQ
VIHVAVPSSLEAYYQEAGRAGRDGKTAYAVLFFTPDDEATQRLLINESHPDAQAVAKVYDAVCNLAQIPHGVQPEDPIALDVDTIAQLTGFSPGRIRKAVDIIIQQETWQAIAPRRHHGLVRFNQSADAVRRYAEGLHNTALTQFVLALLRTVHADAFSGWWEIDLRLLERKTTLPRERLLRGLSFLSEHGIIQWRAPENALRVQFNEARAVRLPVDDLAIRRDKRRAEARLRDMLRYARSITCRRHFLLSYFGEKTKERCGTCDICLGRHQTVVITPKDEPIMRQILYQIQRGVPRDQWFGASTPAAHHVDGLVDWLVQEGFLDVEAPLEEIYAVTEKAFSLMEQWKPRKSEVD